MAVAFLLRFQEQCAESDTVATRCGTQTMTKIQGEQPDADPAIIGRVLPLTVIRAGTKTGTRIPTEQADADRHSTASAIPKADGGLSMATMTVTAIQAEAADQDATARQMHIIPKCSS